MKAVRRNYILVMAALAVGAILGTHPPLPGWLIETLALLALLAFSWAVATLRKPDNPSVAPELLPHLDRQSLVMISVGCAGLLTSAQLLLADTGLRSAVPLANLASWAIGLAAFAAAIHGFARTFRPH